MNVLAQKISEQLLPLSPEEQKLVMNEIQERLLDEEALKVHNSIESGEMETLDSQSVMRDLKAKYAR